MTTLSNMITAVVFEVTLFMVCNNPFTAECLKWMETLLQIGGVNEISKTEW